MHVAQSYSRIIQIGIRIWTYELILGDRKKYATTSNMRYYETCSLTPHVRHSERGSVISDCLVNVCILIVDTHVLLFVCFRSVHHPVKRFPTYTSIALLSVASEEVPYTYTTSLACVGVNRNLKN